MHQMQVHTTDPQMGLAGYTKFSSLLAAAQKYYVRF